MDAAHSINTALLTSLKQASIPPCACPHFVKFHEVPALHQPDPALPGLGRPSRLTSVSSRASPRARNSQRRAGGQHTREHYQREDLMRSLADHCSRRERETASAERKSSVPPDGVPAPEHEGIAPRPDYTRARLRIIRRTAGLLCRRPRAQQDLIDDFY